MIIAVVFKMEQAKKILSDFHLYSDKQEYIIKLGIWWLSWGGGINVLQNKTEGIASAFFVFSLSLLMEFAQKIKYKEEDVSGILHTLFCGMIFVVSVLSGLMLPEGSYSETYHNIIHNLILVALWVMNIDCLILWFTKDTSKPDNSGSMHPEAIEEVLQAFYQKLQSGNLGDIKEGHNDV